MCLLIQINVIFLRAGLPTPVHGLFSVITLPGRRFYQGVVLLSRSWGTISSLHI
ncbi:hypothetical protein AB06_4839 [Escherichia coli 2-474-04_S1_C1]|uniref:Uncharacterized protein n=4 Tax=Enterobacteriaceae TaxID=543 RepID=A0A2R4A8T6_ECOLX|nr:hypothetical protein [Salmonella enterica subsp. enterica serovar Enteritidis]ARO93470.1 hypothetical protein FORC38_1197 [Salmonella enterica]AVR60992.1 hypothetical protein [Escherichia coli]EHV85757.1 hypothetical protein ECDEC7B_4969 [Escherichia coli DEC7B]EHW01878.1 hypothetical protein ECDEC8A_5628 [Escherichia coli DEC8A]KDY73952.1 hypothetical protein AB06_4839 [Escherichia coli 2-474-04_S1_C1]OAF89280.1 hypothetical protein PPECC79_48110 [Escherichia coli PCN079]QIV62337.1 hypot